jgi:hypothetical protein
MMPLARARQRPFPRRSRCVRALMSSFGVQIARAAPNMARPNIMPIH